MHILQLEHGVLDVSATMPLHCQATHTKLQAWTVWQQLSPFLLSAEYAGPEHGLALAVLYYVAPDSGFTLDILQWTPGGTHLSIKLRLQLHELADMHSFLLGCIVLDMCTIPTCQSGKCLICASPNSHLY